MFDLPLLSVASADDNSLLSTRRAPTINGNEVSLPFAATSSQHALIAAPADSSDLLYSTFLGGSSDDYGQGIFVDVNSATYVTGYTYSSNFPVTPGAFDTSYNGQIEAFVARLNAAGIALTYTTFFGGSGDDHGINVTADASGAVYVTGDTDSSDFPTTPGAFDTTFNGLDDAFVLKLTRQGQP